MITFFARIKPKKKPTAAAKIAGIQNLGVESLEKGHKYDST
jgi:hypothetical protein